MAKRMGWKQHKPTPLMEDSQPCMSMTQDIGRTRKNRHPSGNRFFARQAVRNQQVTLVKVSSDQNIADIMTKCQPRNLFTRMKKPLVRKRDLN